MLLIWTQREALWLAVTSPWASCGSQSFLSTSARLLFLRGELERWVKNSFYAAVMPLDRDHLPKHTCESNTSHMAPAHLNDTGPPAGQCVLPHHKHCSATTWGTWQRAQSLDHPRDVPDRKEGVGGHFVWNNVWAGFIGQTMSWGLADVVPQPISVIYFICPWV